MEVAYRIPRPFSVNNMKTRRSSVLSPAYRNWMREADRALTDSGVIRVEGAFEVSIDAPLHGNADADNTIKPILDALQRVGAIENDKLARRVSVNRVPRDGRPVSITVASVDLAI